jgi:hypothetical protein
MPHLEAGIDGLDHGRVFKIEKTPEIIRTRNQTTIKGPKMPATFSVLLRWKAKRYKSDWFRYPRTQVPAL